MRGSRKPSVHQRFRASFLSSPEKPQIIRAIRVIVWPATGMFAFGHYKTARPSQQQVIGLEFSWSGGTIKMIAGQKHAAPAKPKRDTRADPAFSELRPTQTNTWSDLRCAQRKRMSR